MTGDETPQTWALRGALVLPDDMEPDGAVVVQGDRIKWVGPAKLRDVPARYVDVVAGARRWSGGYILPGLVDIHCHGGGGQSFPDARSKADALVAVLEHRRHGTTSLVASLVTDTKAALVQQTGLLADLAEAGELAGIHLEGPFLSPARCGAQDPTKMARPDPLLVLEVAEAGRGFFATMTLAPEIPGAVFHDGAERSVTEMLCQVGAVPSFGHTDCSAEEMGWAVRQAYSWLAQAVADGVGRSRRPTATHLFNGMRPVHHRDPGPVLEALAQASAGCMVVELVADGVHLDPHTVSEVFRIAAPGSVALVTDAMAAAGMPDGQYRLGPMAVTVSDGVAHLTEGGAIAGGTAHLIDVLRVTVKKAGVSLTAAVRAASLTPARVLGIDTEVGSLAAGKRADLVLADTDLNPMEVYRSGQPLPPRESTVV
ncbi:MAG: N-acetylglucosamine-6-phosphate deacetylase [Bifidobacteriaceae bacterium]|nr:N-acetylglucosamine-6-phosphate deacetylase [Bifidobacteriaceae bacterium]